MDQKIPEPLSKPVESTKPSVNVPPATPHTAMATSTPLGTPAANVGKSGRGKSILVVFIILLLAVGCASMGYMLWKAQRDIDILNADHKAALEQWDKKRAETEARIKELEGEGADDEAIKISATNNLEAEVDQVVGETVHLGDIYINSKDSNFATIGVKYNDGPDGVLVLKKVNKSWLVLGLVLGPTRLISADSNFVKSYGYPLP